MRLAAAGRAHGEASIPKRQPSPASSSQEDGESLLRSGLKFSHMRMIVALDDHGRVSAAAHVLNISQPAASRMIAEMEAILDVKLCDRLPRGVALTSYGKALARRARAILLEMREADREIADLKSGRGGAVFVGAVTAPAIDLAVPAIRDVRSLYPRIEINIQVETSNVLARELLASRHDFIIGRIPDDLNPRLFESRVIGIEKACLIVRRGHPLLGGGAPVPLERLTAYDWVFQPGGSLLRRTIEALLIAANVPLPDQVLNTSSLLLTLVMVAQSDAIAPVATEVADFIRAEQGLAGAIEILPVDVDIEVQPYSLIMLRNRALSPAAQILHDFIVRRANMPG
ncbi:LysR family transcriptional regulator [Mesorhizobium sp. L-8-10]|uniref:LysR substrate-binding domain-containing protein n=1 Tax=unclassified Mesorhizobium TaxID=325217 RepID=UPI0019289E79|nr:MULTISPECIES: LysR substrate-binding domain-containing protein [unclassified Mesorhizobium]BCH20680.1 LysR family transcriptional regulator [Mesorhizobium sp. L-8-3]BCH28524.1 LysR family transcriptional regulator [Mesorhizobium sp. L-8-10]